MRGRAAAVLVAAAVLLPALAEEPPAPSKTLEWSERLECGPLVLEVRASRTAHLFHVVDQPSMEAFCPATSACVMLGRGFRGWRVRLNAERQTMEGVGVSLPGGMEAHGELS